MFKNTIPLVMFSVITFCSLFQMPVFATEQNNFAYEEENTKTTQSNIIAYEAHDDAGKNRASTSTTANTSGSVFQGRQGSDCYVFLGLTTWDCGVKISNENNLKTGIWKIVANVATDITIIAAYLVLGYVIYGGYLYIFSGGEPNKVATGRKALSQAFIGLAIVMSAYLIMSTIRFALLGADGNFTCDFMTGNDCVDANTIVTNAISWAIGIGGAVALIFIVYGGISYATSAGDPNKLSKAKQMIIYALIGLAIVGLAEFITAFVSNMIRNADNAATASTNYHQTINLKEFHENHLS